MKINKRQTLTFVAALVMVVSALAFSPASGETGFSASASGYYNNYSFASVNGTAEYTLDLTNSGETDLNFRKQMAYKVFKEVSNYDTAITNWFNEIKR